MSCVRHDRIGDRFAKNSLCHFSRRVQATDHQREISSRLFSGSTRLNAYYVCVNSWFRPVYGANGVYYRVVPAHDSRFPPSSTRTDTGEPRLHACRATAPCSLDASISMGCQNWQHTWRAAVRDPEPSQAHRSRQSAPLLSRQFRSALSRACQKTLSSCNPQLSRARYSVVRQREVDTFDSADRQRNRSR